MYFGLRRAMNLLRCWLALGIYLVGVIEGVFLMRVTTVACVTEQHIFFSDESS